MPGHTAYQAREKREKYQLPDKKTSFHDRFEKQVAGEELMRIHEKSIPGKKEQVNYNKHESGRCNTAVTASLRLSFRKLDEDNSGFVSVPEFVAHMEEVFGAYGGANRPTWAEQLSTADLTKMFDENGDGEISWPEFRHLFEAQDGEQAQEKNNLITDLYNYSPLQIREVFDRLDDGSLHWIMTGPDKSVWIIENDKPVLTKAGIPRHDGFVFKGPLPEEVLQMKAPIIKRESHGTVHGAKIEAVSDGSISCDEFVAGLQKCANMWGLLTVDEAHSGTEAQGILNVFKEIDTSNDGQVTWDEFREYVMKNLREDEKLRHEQAGDERIKKDGVWPRLPLACRLGTVNVGKQPRSTLLNWNGDTQVQKKDSGSFNNFMQPTEWDMFTSRMGSFNDNLRPGQYVPPPKAKSSGPPPPPPARQVAKGSRHHSHPSPTLFVVNGRTVDLRSDMPEGSQ